MTTLAGAMKNGVLAIAADKRATTGSITATPRSKLFRLGNLYVAHGGDALIEQKIRDCKAEEWECRGPEEFFDVFKEIATNLGMKPHFEDDSGNPIYQQSFMVMTVDGLFKIHIDGCIERCEEGFPLAAGTGEELAIGAMEGIIRYAPGVTARELVISAVRVAAKREIYTGNGVTVAWGMIGGEVTIEDFEA